MDPIFIYYNNLILAENKQFTLEFSDEDLRQGIVKKNRDYFLMSMSSFIKVENDITELKQYPAIEKISELANRITKKGVAHGCDSLEIETSYAGKIYEMDILKVNSGKSVDVSEKKICSYLLDLQKTV